MFVTIIVIMDDLSLTCAAHFLLFPAILLPAHIPSKAYHKSIKAFFD